MKEVCAEWSQLPRVRGPVLRGDAPLAATRLSRLRINIILYPFLVQAARAADAVAPLGAWCTRVSHLSRAPRLAPLAAMMQAYKANNNKAEGLVKEIGKDIDQLMKVTDGLGPQSRYRMRELKLAFVKASKRVKKELKAKLELDSAHIDVNKAYHKEQRALDKATAVFQPTPPSSQEVPAIDDCSEDGVVVAASGGHGPGGGGGPGGSWVSSSSTCRVRRSGVLTPAVVRNICFGDDPDDDDSERPPD